MNIYLRFLSIFCILLHIAGCSSGGNDSEPAPVQPAANQVPTSNAGGDVTVSEATTVSLNGSGADSDGSIASYAWTQVSGPPVTIENADQAGASFLAPNMPSEQTVVIQLQVTDDDGATGTSTANVTILDDAEMLIQEIVPDFGLAGSAIEVTAEGTDADTTLVFNGTAITPDSISDNSTRFTFTVPAGGTTGPVKTVSGAKTSNSVWFDVSDLGIVPPAEDKIEIDADGNRVAIDYLLVTLDEASDTRAEADRLAGLVSGAVVGRIEITNTWQIKVDVSSITELEALQPTLEAEPSVEFTVIDIEILPDAVDWSGDPDQPSQRLRNRVEEGVSLFENSVHPTEAGKLRPFFIAMGVAEGGLDFKLPDFSGYAENGGSISGNVAIYATSSDTETDTGRHGSNVVGIIAAELGDGGNAGPIRALGDNLGGANISVGTSFQGIGNRISTAERQLKRGARVLNWSWGLHRKGALSCDGNEVGQNVFDDEVFNLYQSQVLNFFEKLPETYPNAVILSSAGNGMVDAGDAQNRTPTSVESEQLIVVGAHTIAAAVTGGTSEDQFAAGTCFDDEDDAAVKRSNYSNYGTRVDISAAGSVMGYSNGPDANSNSGTSYATPLVTATVALMQSINPNLTPAEIKAMLRSSALPVQNIVQLTDETGASAGSAVFTRVLAAAENPANAGLGARLNVEGAIQAALDSRADDSLTIGMPHSVTLPAGTDQVTATVIADIPLGNIFDKVDIVFVVDVSGSYGDDIANFKAKASELIDAFAAAGSNVRIGLTSFSDYPISPYGGVDDYAFALDQTLTGDFEQIRTAVNLLGLKWGDDVPESQLEALYQTAQSGTGWRSGSLPIIFLATDASFHDSDLEPAYPGRGRTETVAALNARSARVFGLQSGGIVQDVESIATETGGESFVLSRDSSEILAAIEAALEGTRSNIEVTLEPFGDIRDIIDTITPTGVAGAMPGDPVTGVNPGDTVSFDVVFTRGSIKDREAHTFSFRIRVVIDGVAVIIEIPVTVILQ